VGSSNMDLIAYVPTLPKAGETLTGNSFQSGFGGKGANQAVMAALLGANVAFVGKVGDDLYGNQMTSNFEKHNIDISHLNVAQNITSGLAPIFVSESGENCIVVIPGANNLITPEEVRKSSALIHNAKVLLVQLEIPLESTIEALKVAKENPNVITILNPAPAPKTALPDHIFQYVDILCPNETELSILTGNVIDGISAIKTATKTLLDRGVKQLIVTMGKDGSILVNRQQAVHVPAIKLTRPVIDTAGAGDCFLGSFAYFLANGNSTVDSMKIASFIAGISVTRKGTQTSYPARNELPFDVKDIIEGKISRL